MSNTTNKQEIKTYSKKNIAPDLAPQFRLMNRAAKIFTRIETKIDAARQCLLSGN